MSPPVAGISLARRFFGLVENYPLYLMVGIACGLGVYTPIRHLVTASDVALDRTSRGDEFAADPRVLVRAHYYESGVLAWAASLRRWPQVWSLPKGVDPQGHFTTSRWPRERTYEVPQVPN